MGDHFLPLLALTLRGAAPVKTSTGHNFTRKIPETSPKSLPVLARWKLRECFLTFSTILAILHALREKVDEVPLQSWQDFAAPKILGKKLLLAVSCGVSQEDKSKLDAEGAYKV